jgi:VIT1/CCC1 family predicted Fe2+/Mn2+ transporter
MGVGNYLSIRAHESVLDAQQLPEEEASPVRHGVATFAAFVLAGVLPLVPYMIPDLQVDRFPLSIAFTLIALFGVGASRALISDVTWWRGGLEMLTLGAIVAIAAYYSGAGVAAVLSAG